MESNIFSLKDLKNKKVTNRDGDSLGHIDELVLDLQTGQMAYLLLASGGFLGIGEKYVPVPPNALTYNPRAGSYQMDVTKDQLKNAPHIEMKDWPNRPDKKYVDDLYRYYGYQPYNTNRK